MCILEVTCGECIKPVLQNELTPEPLPSVIVDRAGQIHLRHGMQEVGSSVAAPSTQTS